MRHVRQMCSAACVRYRFSLFDVNLLAAPPVLAISELLYCTFPLNN